MNGSLEQITESSIHRYTFLYSIHIWNQDTPVPVGGLNCSCGVDYKKAGVVIRGHPTSAEREERTTGAYRNLSIIHLLLSRRRNGQSISDLQTANTKRNATPGTRATSERDNQGSMEKRIRLYLPAQPCAYLLPVWRSYRERGRRDCQFTPIL